MKALGDKRPDEKENSKKKTTCRYVTGAKSSAWGFEIPLLQKILTKVSLFKTLFRLF